MCSTSSTSTTQILSRNDPYLGNALSTPYPFIGNAVPSPIPRPVNSASAPAPLPWKFCKQPHPPSLEILYLAAFHLLRSPVPTPSPHHWKFCICQIPHLPTPLPRKSSIWRNPNPLPWKTYHYSITVATTTPNPLPWESYFNTCALLGYPVPAESLNPQNGNSIQSKAPPPPFPRIPCVCSSPETTNKESCVGCQIGVWLFQSTSTFSPSLSTLATTRQVMGKQVKPGHSLRPSFA